MTIPCLTICYMTNRQYPCWQWFFDSLRRERETDNDPIQVIVVDFFADERQGELPSDILHVSPKPTVWQGKHRLTTRDYFAAANARNTALCFAPDGWIAYVDDLSVLLPGWLKYVREAMSGGYVCAGAYRKVFGLEVVDGVVQSFVDYPQGHDSRWNGGHDDLAVHTGAGSVFGCSLAVPVGLLLAVNGWDEGLCDGMGYEDSAMGMRLANIGADIRYDRRMMTYESEELHHIGTPFLRVDKKIADERGPDASHAMVRTAQKTKQAANLHLGMSMRDLREAILAGYPFPVPTEPTTHWPDGQPLSEM